MRTLEEQIAVDKQYNLGQWIEDSDGAKTVVAAPIWTKSGDPSPIHLSVREAPRRSSVRERPTPLWLSADGAEELGLRLIAAARDFRARHGLPDPEEKS
jgi:hypothetical protein